MFWLFCGLQLLLPLSAWLVARRIYRHFQTGEKVHESVLRQHFTSYLAGACTIALVIWFALVAIIASFSGTVETYALLAFIPAALSVGLLIGALAWSVEIREYLSGRPSSDW